MKIITLDFHKFNQTAFHLDLQLIWCEIDRGAPNLLHLHFMALVNFWLLIVIYLKCLQFPNLTYGSKKL